MHPDPRHPPKQSDRLFELSDELHALKVKAENVKAKARQCSVTVEEDLSSVIVTIGQSEKRVEAALGQALVLERRRNS